MKKLLALLGFVSFLGAQAQDEKGLLWEISGNGLEKSSYLYGTIHIICPDDYFMADATKKAFESADQVYMELDMDDPKLMAQLQFQMMLMDGKTLKDHCSEEDYTLLDAYFIKKMNVGMAQLGRMKPLALMSMSYMSLLNCQTKSYETEFSMMAKEGEKEILGFETAMEQMQIFDKIPYAEQMKMLADMIRKEDQSLAEFAKMVAEYKEQDLSGLLKVMDDSEWNMEQYEGALIHDRNAKWIPTIEEQAKLKSTFIAVGAGHLGGEKGLISLLKEKGYMVIPLN